MVFNDDITVWSLMRTLPFSSWFWHPRILLPSANLSDFWNEEKTVKTKRMEEAVSPRPHVWTKNCFTVYQLEARHCHAKAAISQSVENEALICKPLIVWSSVINQLFIKVRRNSSVTDLKNTTRGAIVAFIRTC